MRSNEYIEDYLFSETVCRPEKNFLPGLKDRMISGRKSLWMRSKENGFSYISLPIISLDMMSVFVISETQTKELATYGDSCCVL
jgi:hypothetical protein